MCLLLLPPHLRQLFRCLFRTRPSVQDTSARFNKQTFLSPMLFFFHTHTHTHTHIRRSTERERASSRRSFLSLETIHIPSTAKENRKTQLPPLPPPPPPPTLRHPSCKRNSSVYCHSRDLVFVIRYSCFLASVYASLVYIAEGGRGGAVLAAPPARHRISFPPTSK